MTIWEHMVANSTLAEAEGDFWEHLTNPSGTGSTSGGIFFNGEVIGINEIKSDGLEEVTQSVGILEQSSSDIEESAIIVQILSIKEDEIDGL